MGFPIQIGWQLGTNSVLLQCSWVMVAVRQKLHRRMMMGWDKYPRAYRDRTDETIYVLWMDE